MIHIERLDKYYNKKAKNSVHAINDVNLEFDNTGMVAIFGRSGCGKTTLLNTIGGLDSYDDGKIIINDDKMTVNNDVLKNKYIGYIFQNYNLQNDKTCFENVANSLKLCGIHDENIIYNQTIAALKAVNMDNYKNRLPDTLSGGQQQRIAIARAIVKDPKIILADEPTGNLDETNTLQVMELLKKISKNRLVILVTHEEDLVSHYCNKIVNIQDGKVINIEDNDIKTDKIRNKHDIYLGDFKKNEFNNDDVNINYYGENPNSKINIKIVNNNGKIYLKVENDDVIVLDKKSEIKLKDEKYVDYQKLLDNNDNNDIAINQIEYGKDFGNLYDLHDAIKEGYKINFVTRKRRNLFFRIVIAIFSVVFLFVACSLGNTIKNYNNVLRSVDSNIFYIHVANQDDVNKVFNMENDDNSGVDYVRLMNKSPFSNEDSLYLKKGKFESINQGGIYYGMQNSVVIDNIRWLDNKLINQKVVAGNIDNLKSNDLVITTSIAKQIIKQIGYDFISQYDDLIGLNTTDNAFKIAAIVDDLTNNVYANNIAIADVVMSSGGFVSAGSLYGYKINDGEAIVSGYISHNINKATVGQTLKLNDVEVKIKEKIELAKEIIYVSDNDILKMSKRLGNVSYNHDLDYDEKPYVDNRQSFTYNSYFAIIHSNNTNKTNNYINNNFTKYEMSYTLYSINEIDKISSIYTPEQIKNETINVQKEDIISQSISLIVMLSIMVICMYFIIKTSLFSRIKEIGILRAIGVSKKNITFKFLIEAIILSILTIGLGFVIGSIFIYYFSNKVSAFSNSIYSAFWYILVVYILLCGICIIFSLIPIFNLNRKTPSQILSKYDI